VARDLVSNEPAADTKASIPEETVASTFATKGPVADSPDIDEVYCL
jgi:hypothetical protein